jgi:hypothetical protein
MCCSPKSKTTRPKKKIKGTLMGDLTAEERQRFIVRANIAADKRAAIEKKKKAEHILLPQKQSLFHRFRQIVS